MSAPQRYIALRFIVVFLTAVALIDLLLELVVVGWHAYAPASVATAVLSPMTIILAGASGAALVLATLYAVLRYPAQRKTLLLLTILVAGIFGAHLYTINLPALGATNTLSGQVGGYLRDNQVTVYSSLSGSNLAVTVTDTGGDAIGSLSLAVGNTTLPGSGFASSPTATAALQPGKQDNGTWSLDPVPSGPLTLTYEHLTCYATDKQVDGCIMDEVYYVPAAQTMLSGEKCAPYADNCNLEHPFLSKAFIAAGIAMFGNDAFGWRIFEVILGTFSIPVLFGICLAVTKNQRLSLFAAFLLAFETLFFVHSSIAVIDVGAIFFGLLGFLFYFAKAHWWKLGTLSLTGIAFGLAGLTKETAIFLFLALFLYHLFFAPGSRKQIIVSTTKLVVPVLLVFVVGLQIYDGAFGSGVATTFLGQIEFILRYGASLTMTPSSQGWIDTLLKTPITPWSWVTYYSPIGYLITNVSVSGATGSYTYVSAGYYGVTNQFEVWLVYLWGGYTAYLWWKTRGKTFATESETREFNLARLALIWFLVVFLGYLVLFYYGRITYPYYFISAVPSLAIGAAYFLTRSWFPPLIAYILLAGVFLWFFIFYPDKSFLPVQLRVWLGH
ncbi:MAG TPA: phospholipid carrier-dependent glycosyltransferase [Nitrososphaerales archaeon]|nr:phospholipid carrier-dependent glycosyltransferase [Nitrososphaerales archaeon]